MFHTLFKLMTRRALLLIVVDVTDKEEIQNHIERLENIRDGVVPTVEEKKRKRAFAGLSKPFDHKLTLRRADGVLKTVSRANNPSFLELLDYLYDHPEAEYMSVRKLGDAVGVSKSLADEAKQYWALEENREAFTAFREQEDTVPF